MSVIKIKLSKIITKEKFKSIQQEIWEWFGDIQKRDITVNILIGKEDEKK